MVATAVPLKSRGAISNVIHRYAKTYSLPITDGWYEEELDRGKFETELIEEHPKTIITTNNSPDVPFNRSINPYQGCEHGCVYCYARPTHAYWDASPGLDFETKLFYKANAAELLERAFQRSSYRCEPIALGTNTDPYQPVERRLEITRQLLELMAEYQHPCTIVTKSAGVLRDLDILADLAKRGLCAVYLSVTSLDNELKRKLEPRAASPKARLHAIRKLSRAGVPVGVLVAPLIPAINDGEMEAILKASESAGARSATYILLRLPHEVRPLFREWLATHFPEKFNYVMNLIRETRGGKENSARFGERMRGSGAYADMLKQRFMIKRNHLGLSERLPELNVSLFKQVNRRVKQLNLF